MDRQVKKRALLATFGILVPVLARRYFFIQELFFAFLFFAAGYLVILVVVGLAFGFWFVYARGVVYLATRAMKGGQRALPLLRVVVLWLAPTVTKTAEAVSAGQQILFYPIGGLLHRWLRFSRVDAEHLGEDTERAIEHLRLPIKLS